MKLFYVVFLNFEKDKAFKENYEEAIAYFNSKIGTASHVELKQFLITPLGCNSSSVKVWKE